MTVGVDVSGEGYLARLGPVSTLISFVATAGVWLDRFRIEAGAGVGGAGCDKAHCVPDGSEEQINYTTVFPFHLGAKTPLFEFRQVSVGVGLRYRAVKLAADTLQGRESFWAHGPVLAPYVGAIDPTMTEQRLGGSRTGTCSSSSSPRSTSR